MPYSELYSFSNQEVDFAVDFPKSGSTTVRHGTGLREMFVLPLILSNCFPLRFPLFAFYDYSGNRVGVASLLEGKVAWSVKIKVHGCDYIGIDEVCGEVLLQKKGGLWVYEGGHGELLRKLSVSGKIRKKSGECMATSNGARTRIDCPGGAVHLDHDAYKVQLFGRNLVLIDPQVGLSVVNLDTTEILRRFRPPDEARFSSCLMSGDGTLTAGVSYFDKPATTEAWRYETLDHPTPEVVELGCAGSYIIVGDGKEFAFAAGKRYSALTGKQIGIL